MKTILLVEDNEADELLTLRALRRASIQSRIDVVRDGQQALDYLLRQGEHGALAQQALPTVVLLDISLPRLSGLDVLEQLRRQPSTRLLPVVMLTSSDEPCDRLRSYQHGANSFVRKPVAFADFAETVARIGHYWVDTNLGSPD